MTTGENENSSTEAQTPEQALLEALFGDTDVSAFFEAAPSQAEQEATREVEALYNRFPSLRDLNQEQQIGVDAMLIAGLKDTLAVLEYIGQSLRLHDHGFTAPDPEDEGKSETTIAQSCIDHVLAITYSQVTTHVEMAEAFVAQEEAELRKQQSIEAPVAPPLEDDQSD